MSTTLVKVPSAEAVSPHELAKGFAKVHAAVCARAAHYAELGDKPGAARIGLLVCSLQEWVDSWWEGLLFRIEVNLGVSELDFAQTPALRYNFCNWWLLSASQQNQIVHNLVRLSVRIEGGDYDRARELVRPALPQSLKRKLTKRSLKPPLQSLPLTHAIYAVRGRDGSTALGQVSSRLAHAPTSKALSW